MLEIDDYKQRQVDACVTVNVADDEDVAFWAAVFGVTSREIQHAVVSVGGDAGAVERFVRDNTSAVAAASARQSTRPDIPRW